MAKSGQKRKKAEKSKTQLKTSMKAAGKADKKKKVKGQSGIRLPKGLNEVKPEVKTKGISMREDLAPVGRRERLEAIKEVFGKTTDKSDGQNEKKRQEQRLQTPKRLLRPLREILNKMKHHSHFNRLEALKTLKDILHDCPDAARAELSEVLRRTLPLSIDPDDQVRTLFHEVFRLLLGLLPRGGRALGPAHRELLRAHLCSALTHVSAGVRSDALLAVDAASELAPALAVRCHDSILPHCVSQLSTASATSGGKKTAAASRLAALKRILDLMLLVGRRRDQSLRPAEVSMEDVRRAWDSMRVRGEGEGFAADRDRMSFARKFSEKLVPRLLDCWREAMPDTSSQVSDGVGGVGGRKGGRKKRGGKGSMTTEEADVMLKVAEVMEKLHGMLESEEEKAWFSSSFIQGTGNFGSLASSFLAWSSASDVQGELVPKLRLVSARVCLSSLDAGDLAGTEEILGEVAKSGGLVVRDPSSRTLAPSLLLLIFRRQLGGSGEVRLEAARLEKLFWEVVEEVSSIEGETTAELMLEVFRQRGLRQQSSRAWFSSIPSALATGCATPFHLEALSLAARTRSPEAAEVLEAALEEDEGSFFSASVTSAQKCLALALLAAFCLQTGSGRATAVGRTIFERVGAVVDQNEMEPTDRALIEMAFGQGKQ